MTSNTISSDKLLIAKAKRKAAEWMPFLQSVFGPMRCIATKQCPTAGVDQFGRMYYNPEFFGRLSVEVVAYIILHETLHCVLSHCKRTQRMVPDHNQQKRLLANIAQDLCIQQALKSEIGGFEPENIVTLEGWSHIPGITPKRTSEQYYEALLAHQQTAPQQPPKKDPGQGEADDENGDDEQDSDDESECESEADDGDESDDESDEDSGDSDGDSDDETTDDAEDGDSEGGEGGEPSDSDSDDDGDSDSDDDEGDSDGAGQGSGDDGQGGEANGEPSGGVGDGKGDRPVMPPEFPEVGEVLNPADAGSNSDGEPKEWEEEPTLADISSLEKRLREAETALDDMEPSLGSGAGQIREALKARLRPLPDPFDQLKHVVSKSIASPVGMPNMTYRKWPRRTLPGKARLRGVEKLQPEAVVLLDTSGSMLQCSVKEKALAIIAKGISRLQNPRIVCCDGAIQSARRVCNMSHFTWDGGGGTDMAAGLVHVDEKYEPDTIVIITDGITDWPRKPTRAKVVCALCRPEWAARIPKWITVVHLYREPRKYAL